MITVKLTISGKVQGVWYRAAAKDKAIDLGVKGKVWNTSSGDVGAIAQGTQQQIEQFVAWCKEGPPLAKVEQVEVAEIEVVELFEGFMISKEI
jgi:acylphosphatase